jgi:DNA-binding NarL/FixJ family response regulator
MSSRGTPIQVALVNDYDVVVTGVAHMLDRYADRVVVAELDTNRGVREVVDVVLYDNFARPESDRDEVGTLVANPAARRVVVYTWNLHLPLIESARQVGVDGYLSKALPARDLVAALERVHAGEAVFADVAPRVRSAPGLDWPGRREGLTDRESEILALIAQGMSNAQVAELTFLSPNTVKSYIRAIYRKIQVGSRTQAVLWGVEHGFTPDHHRIEHWRPARGAGPSAGR